MKTLISFCSIAFITLIMFACKKEEKKEDPQTTESEHKKYTYILTYDTGYSYSMGQYKPGLGRIIDSTIIVVDLENDTIQIGETIYGYFEGGDYYVAPQRMFVSFSGIDKKWIDISHTVGIGTQSTRLLRGHKKE